MGIRQCAMDSSAFRKLKGYYDDREAFPNKWREQGGKVVGELGADVPDEYIIAAGMLPVRVYAAPKENLPEAGRYLEYAFDPVMRAVFEKIADGTYAGQIDVLALSNSTDVIIRLYLYLRELRRVEPDRPLPGMAFIDWLFTRNRLHQERNEFIMKKFLGEVERWSQTRISEEAVKKAADLCNRDRQTLRRMGMLRRGREVRISGCEALVIIGSAFFMEREEHLSLVEQIAGEAEKWPVLDGIRVFYTGSAQEDTKLYEILENCDCVVVGEDHDWGDRFYERDFRTEYGAVRGAVDRYMLREFSSKKAFVSQRVDAINRMADSTGAQAVFFYSHIYEEAASWDYPEQKKSLEARGIKTASFSKMVWPCWKNEGLEERIRKVAEKWK